MAASRVSLALWSLDTAEKSWGDSSSGLGSEMHPGPGDTLHAFPVSFWPPGSSGQPGGKALPGFQ